MENEYATLFKKYQLGTTIWSPLASGVLSGKHKNGIAQGTNEQRAKFAADYLTKENIIKVEKLSVLAKELDCTMAQLAIAWCLKNPNVSSVITGATSVNQVKDNMKSVLVKDRLTGEVVSQIERILAAS